jgi:uncharacterized membrane protein YsdA (DUF1294 family)
MEKSLFLPEGTTVTGFVVLGDFRPLLWIWLIAVNAAAFLVFGLDKWKARRKAKNEAIRRIPEKTLFLLAVLGGSAGAILGMRVFHHKTLHRRFRYGLPVILVLQLALAAWIAWRVLAH